MVGSQFHPEQKSAESNRLIRYSTRISRRCRTASGNERLAELDALPVWDSAETTT